MLMDCHVSDILVKIIDEHGVDICVEHKKCEAIILDYCPTYIKEVNILLISLKANIPFRLLSKKNDFNPEHLISIYVNELCDKYSIRNQEAVWAIGSWAYAFKIIPDVFLSEFQPQQTVSLSQRNILPPKALDPKWISINNSYFLFGVIIFIFSLSYFSYHIGEAGAKETLFKEKKINIKKYKKIEEKNKTLSLQIIEKSKQNKVLKDDVDYYTREISSYNDLSRSLMSSNAKIEQLKQGLQDKKNEIENLRDEAQKKKLLLEKIESNAVAPLLLVKKEASTRKLNKKPKKETVTAKNEASANIEFKKCRSNIRYNKKYECIESIFLNFKNITTRKSQVRISIHDPNSRVLLNRFKEVVRGSVYLTVSINNKTLKKGKYSVVLRSKDNVELLSTFFTI